MSQVAFDTLKFTETLKQAGVPEQQAKAEAIAIQGAFSEALNTQVATKADIQKLKDEIQDVKAEQRLLKWMIGFNLALSSGILFILLQK